MADEDKKNEQQANQDASGDEPLVNPDDGILDMDALMGEAANRDAEDDADEGGAEDEAQQLREQLMRTLAELDNTRKRAERDIAQARKFAITDFARDLLSASDNLRRALESAPEDRDELDITLKNLVIGIEMTEKEMLGVFEKHGIRKIEPLGEKFDYNLHQAMFEVPDAKSEPGTVVQVMQPGYVLQDRLLRAAMVGVSKSPEEKQDSVDTTA
ncbi:nucleotide exchange factor GrpE [Nisaea acidiphila]|uniref:Protein GrpE n=1 Tax=Nisaea acidiphila TaxID=1862145 RepID=A0A9J7B3E5_9PROT|nr:nucleotide exchange factor GrpE [Nisaea acidiphila]UUX52157.1 nucleotide exchange factor GrpE [Nisaea acidiphila]